MKVLKQICLYIPMALLALSSCTEDEFGYDVQTSTRTLVAAIENQGGTRMTMGSGTTDRNRLSWSADDQLKVFNAAGESNTFTTTKDDAAIGKFTLADATAIADPLYAFYPGGDNTTFSNGENANVTMTLSNLIDATTVSNLCNVPLYAGMEEESNSISFKYMTAVMRLDLKQLPKETQKIIVTANRKIAGTFTSTIADGMTLDAGTEENENANENTVTITIADQASDAAIDKMVYVPLPVSDDMTITVKLWKGSDDNVEELTKLENKPFKRATVYTVSRVYTISDTTPSGVSAAMEDIVADAAEGAEVTVDLENAVQATSSDATINVPQEENINVVLNFKTPPTTSDGSSLIIQSGTDTAVGDAKNEMTITMPAITDAGSGSGLSVVINAPTTTVNLESTATEGTTTFETLTATTANNTLVIGENITIGTLTVGGGNVWLTDDTSSQVDAYALASGFDGPVYVFTGAESLPAGTSEKFIKVDSEIVALQRALNTGGSYTLQKDIDITNVGLRVPVGITATLELNGKTITAANTEQGNIDVYGNLTIKASKKSYIQSTTDGECGVIVVDGVDAKLTTEGKSSSVNINITAATYGIVLKNDASVKTKYSPITATKYALSAEEPTDNRESTSDVDMSFGSNFTSSSDYAVYIPSAKRVHVASGSTTIKGVGGVIAMKKGYLHIQGGTFEITATKEASGGYTPSNAIITTSGNCQINLESGKYNAKSAGMKIIDGNFFGDGTASQLITGGTYNGVSLEILEYASANDNGNNSTITFNLQSDVSLSKPIRIKGANVTLAMGTYSITGATEGFSKADDDLSLISVRGKATLTINATGDIIAPEGSGLYALDVQGENINTSLTISTGGTFKGCGTAVYAKTGSVTIKGGTFDAWTTSGDARIIDCDDDAYSDGTAIMNISGGTFCNFNPADNPEGENTDYCAENYIATQADDPVTNYVVGPNAMLTELNRLTTALKSGGTFTLQQDVVATSKLVCEKKITVDLNGHTITANHGAKESSWPNTVFYLQKSAQLTVTDSSTEGTGKIVQKTAFDKNPIFFLSTNGSNKLTVNGGEFVSEHDNVVWVTGTSTATLTKGTFKSAGSECIYAEKGTINISGGYYEGTTPYADAYFVVNNYDPNKNTNKITITGGEFLNFNPGNNAADGAGTSYLPDGDDYEVVDKDGNVVTDAHDVKGSDMTYTVQQKTNPVE